MQKFYYWAVDEHYLSFEYKKPKGFELILEKIEKGEHIADVWTNFPFKMENRKKRIADFPYLSLLFKAISERAMDCLRGILEPHVEIFPLNIVNSDLKYYGINFLRIYDIDMRRSDVLGSCVTGKNGQQEFGMTCIDRFAFPENKLPDVPVFRIRGRSNVYMSGEFQKEIVRHKLVGLTFDDELKYRTENSVGKCCDYNGNPFPHPYADHST